MGKLISLHLLRCALFAVEYHSRSDFVEVKNSRQYFITYHYGVFSTNAGFFFSSLFGICVLFWFQV